MIFELLETNVALKRRKRRTEKERTRAGEGEREYKKRKRKKEKMIERKRNGDQNTCGTGTIACTKTCTTNIGFVLSKTDVAEIVHANTP